MLPKKFVESGLALAKGSSLFGVSFDDMTRDELIAYPVVRYNFSGKRQYLVF